MPRSCNQLVHKLAALGAADAPSFNRVWLENYPCAVTRAMSGDFVELS